MPNTSPKLRPITPGGFSGSETSGHHAEVSPHIIELTPSSHEVFPNPTIELEHRRELGGGSLPLAVVGESFNETSSRQQAWVAAVAMRADHAAATAVTLRETAITDRLSEQGLRRAA